MKNRTATWTLGILLLSAPAFGASNDENPPAPDNTEMNKQAGATADDQSMNAQDTELVRKIRASVMKDGSLSTYAHNVKIIAKNGKVTLRGPVRSEAEKATVDRMATEIAGAGNVTNDLTIAPAK